MTFEYRINHGWQIITNAVENAREYSMLLSLYVMPQISAYKIKPIAYTITLKT